MHYAPRILLYCTAWMSVFVLCLAETPLDPAAVKNLTKDVETVLSPSLVGELQGSQSNRSAVNAEQTVQRDVEQPRSINDKKPDIKFDNQVHPYHYERSYHYQYPPPHGDPSRPVGYSETYYDPHYRPRSYDPGYYRSDFYRPYSPSRKIPTERLETSQATGSTNDNADIDRVPKPVENSGISQGVGGPTPPPSSAFPHPNVLKSPPPPLPLPSVDFAGYRPSVFTRPIVRHYYRPSRQGGAPPSNLPGYLPREEERFTEPFPPRPVDPYPPLPPLESFETYPAGKEFQDYDDGRRAAPFLGSFFPPGYQSPFYGSYRPTERFNNLFSDNFTRSFPSRPSFGGFYADNNYPAPPQPSPPGSYPAQADPKPVEPVPLVGDASSQPSPTAKPLDPSTPAVAASNTNYVKLFYQPRNNADRMLQPRDKELTYIGRSYRLY